ACRPHSVGHRQARAYHDAVGHRARSGEPRRPRGDRRADGEEMSRLVLAALLLFTAAPAFALDAGIYAIVTSDGHVMPTVYRLHMKGAAWVLEDRAAN